MTESRRPSLTQQQAVLLAMEAESAVNLLRDGREALRTMTYSSRGADTVWTLLSLGTEKLLKLSLGLADLDVTREWPGSKLRAYNHRVVRLDVDVHALMAARIDRAVQPAYARRALIALDADTMWPKIREGIERYGSGGRYHYLDWIAEQPPFDSPRGYWNEIENEALRLHPDIRALFGSLAPADFQMARRQT